MDSLMLYEQLVNTLELRIEQLEEKIKTIEPYDDGSLVKGISR